MKNRDMTTVVAEVTINDQTSAQIRADGHVTVLEPSDRLDEILSIYRRSVTMGSLMGLTPVLSTCWSLDGDKHMPEFRLVVDIQDWIIGDIVGPDGELAECI